MPQRLIQTRVDGRVHAKFMKMARRKGLSLAAYARILIHEHVAAEDKRLADERAAEERIARLLPADVSGKG
jgi:hypothetical protein